MLACQNETSDCDACAPRIICRHRSRPCTATRALGNSSGHCVCHRLIGHMYQPLCEKLPHQAVHTSQEHLVTRQLRSGDAEMPVDSSATCPRQHVSPDKYIHNRKPSYPLPQLHKKVGTFSEEANRPGHAYKNIDMQTCAQTLRTRIIE